MLLLFDVLLIDGANGGVVHEGGVAFEVIIGDASGLGIDEGGGGALSCAVLTPEE